MNISEINNVKHDRRNFLKYLLTTGIVGLTATVLYPLVSFLKPPKQREVEVTSVTVGNKDDIKKDGFKIVRFGNKPVIVIHSPNDKFLAFSAVCTHLDCTVQYRKDEHVIWCACHNGRYDLTGRNISGPPPKPLEKYKTIVKGKELLVAKINT